MNNIYYYLNIYFIIQGFILVIVLQHFDYTQSYIFLGKLFLLLYILLYILIIKAIHFIIGKKTIRKEVNESRFDSFDIEEFKNSCNK